MSGAMLQRCRAGSTLQATQLGPRNETGDSHQGSPNPIPARLLGLTKESPERIVQWPVSQEIQDAQDLDWFASVRVYVLRRQ